MKKGKIIFGICLLVVAFILSVAQTVYAVEPINLDGFEDMPTTNTTTTNNTATETNKQTNNTTTNTNNASNTGSQAKTKMPQTGSNSGIVFVSGVTALTAIAIVMFKKFANIKLQ